MIFSLLFLSLNLSSLFRFSSARGAALHTYNQSGIALSILLSALLIWATIFGFYCMCEAIYAFGNGGASEFDLIYPFIGEIVIRGEVDWCW